MTGVQTCALPIYKAKLSLYKKSVNSGISANILEEVYFRGYKTWNESFGGTPEQFAFDRVNSFISGGFAAERLDSDLVEKVKEPTGKLKDACWTGYTAVGMKMKNGRKVPNCVPIKEEQFPTIKTRVAYSKVVKDPEKGHVTIIRNRDIEIPHPGFPGARIGPEYVREKIHEHPETKKAKEDKFAIELIGDHYTKETHYKRPVIQESWPSRHEPKETRPYTDASKGKTKEEIEAYIKARKKAYQEKFKKENMKEAFETSEKQSKNPDDSSSRFDGTTSVARIYSNDTPGQKNRDTSKRDIQNISSIKKIKNILKGK